MPRWILFCCCVLPWAALSAAAPPPSTGPSDKLGEGQQLERGILSLPTLGTFKLSDVMTLSLDGTTLVVRTSLPESDGEHQLAVQDTVGLWSVLVPRMRQPGSGSRVPGRFQLKHLELHTPRAIFSQVCVYFNAGRLMLAEDSETPESSLSVQLVDELSDAGAAGLQEKLTLYVLRTNSAERQLVNTHFSAPDLKTLARDHAAEVRQYLRPMLRSLGQDALLAVDPGVAWQVLGADAAPSEAVRQQAGALLRQLDADSFHDRAAAADQLRELGGIGAMVLMHADARQFSDEQRARVDALLQRYQTLQPGAVAKLGQDADFLVDCLEAPELELRRLAQARLGRTLGRPIQFDPAATADARAAAIERLRLELHPPPVTAPATQPSESRR